MNVIGLQLDIAWEDKTANFAKVHRLLSEAAPEKNSLVVLPELFATGFSMNTSALAEDYSGLTEQFLAATAKDFGVWIVGGAAMRGHDGRVRNKALVFSPAGELIAWYAKMRPFTLGGESQHYTAGERTCVFAWSDCTVGLFICYDLRFPELFRQSAAAHLPELFVVIASWPEKRIHHWTRLLQARAIENQAFVVGVNRTGRDPKYNHTGRSAIMDYHGEIAAELREEEGCVRAALDLETLREYRRTVPFLNDLKL